MNSSAFDILSHALPLPLFPMGSSPEDGQFESLSPSPLETSPLENLLEPSLLPILNPPRNLKFEKYDGSSNSTVYMGLFYQETFEYRDQPEIFHQLFRDNLIGEAREWLDSLSSSSFEDFGELTTPFHDRFEHDSVILSSSVNLSSSGLVPYAKVSQTTSALSSQDLLPCASAFTPNQCSEFPLDRFFLSPHLHAFRLMIDLPPMLGHVPKILIPFSPF